MGVAWLYTLAGCDACGRARGLLAKRGYTVREVPIDNPLLELGVRRLFRDQEVHAPVVVLPSVGVYTLSTDEPPQLLRIVSLEADAGS